MRRCTRLRCAGGCRRVGGSGLRCGLGRHCWRRRARPARHVWARCGIAQDSMAPEFREHEIADRRSWRLQNGLGCSHKKTKGRSRGFLSPSGGRTSHGGGLGGAHESTLGRSRVDSPPSGGAAAGVCRLGGALRFRSGDTAEPHAERGAKPTAPATEDAEPVAAAIGESQAQETVSRDAALEDGVELVLDEFRQTGARWPPHPA